MLVVPLKVVSGNSSTMQLRRRNIGITSLSIPISRLVMVGCMVLAHSVLSTLRQDMVVAEAT